VCQHRDQAERVGVVSVPPDRDGSCQNVVQQHQPGDGLASRGVLLVLVHQGREPNNGHGSAKEAAHGDRNGNPSSFRESQGRIDEGAVKKEKGKAKKSFNQKRKKKSNKIK